MAIYLHVYHCIHPTYINNYKQYNYLLTPCFCIDTLVRCTNMLSSSLTLELYFTVQNLQNPS